MKVVLDTILSGFNLVKINANFQKLANAVNLNILWRTSVTGEANAMNDDLDMNSKRIYNLPAPSHVNEAARLQDVVDATSGIPSPSLITYTASATGAIARPLQSKLGDVIDAADFIATPGASDALDQAGVQAAVNKAAINGGTVVVRKPIRNVWNFTLLSIPANVLIRDERYIDIGHRVEYSTSGDMEHRIHGTSVTGGEGPTFTAVNNATSGDQTVSFVGRSGSGAGTVVTGIFHIGWWTGTVWKKCMDFLTQHSDGFRSTFRLGFGSAIVNPGGTNETIDPEIASASGWHLVVNRKADAGGGLRFYVKEGAIVAPIGQDIQMQGGALRLQNTAGSNRFSLISDYPTAGQVTLYDHIAGVDMAVFTSSGAMSTSLMGVTFATPVAAVSVPNNTLFKDSADGKLKFKDNAGTTNLLY